MMQLLFQTMENPRPANADAAFVPMRDGRTLRVGLFHPEQRSDRGTVVVLTGRNECVEKYFETASDLTKRGFTVAVLDWRGQGLSHRPLKNPARGHIRNFQTYVDDLEEVFQKCLLPDCPAPYNILAHSTGGLIALLAAPRLINRVNRMVLAAPLLTITDMPLSPQSIKRLTSVLYWMGLGRAYFGSGPRPKGGPPFLNNKVTSDPKRFRRNQDMFNFYPQLSMGGPTIAWVRAAGRAIDRIHKRRFIEELRIPTLFVAAGNDHVVSTPAIETYANHMRSGHVVTIDGANHEILQEQDIYREQLLAAFDAFIENRSAARGQEKPSKV